jgi:DNA repair photolyase
LAADDGGQGSLFDEETLGRRRVGTGEFRGLEFLEVEARQVINRVPESSRMPFRWTINAYRGCSHACSYCLSGATPVLMADGRTKPLADIRTGDEVYGTVRDGSYRRYVTTPVLAHWMTVKPGYEIILEDGTSLVASEDHRFLTYRGWKHVTGEEQGHWRRPHLTTNNKLMGTGKFARAPEDHPDYRLGYLCGLVRGDGHSETFFDRRPGRPGISSIYRFRLATVDVEGLQRAQGLLRESGVDTKSFVFQQPRPDHRGMTAIHVQARGAFERIRQIIAWPREPSIPWAKGFLAGVFDAEGSYGRGALRIATTDWDIAQQVEACMRRLDFRAQIEKTNWSVAHVRLLGGLPEQLRFFHTVDPAIQRKRSITGTAIKSNAKLRVVSIRALGHQLEMFDITTGTHDFVANGVISHNCFARPTHEWLGLDTGADFERRIVVKVNAAERVRAELASPRWGGEPVAMGTNTDPYQRAEGKYRLTRGIVEALSAAANPFSILTKSTLILGDLERLAEAARRTTVRADLSIGTLDEEVWRISEPGTPHPRQRVAAVARLNGAGIPSGVLVAPVLPGMSDHPDQLEEVVNACVEAGAAFVSVVALHLRPGVAEHYMAWLDSVRPDLVAEYERRYRGKSYLPKRDQQELSELVAGLVRAARHRRR